MRALTKRTSMPCRKVTCTSASCVSNMCCKKHAENWLGRSHPCTCCSQLQQLVLTHCLAFISVLPLQICDHHDMLRETRHHSVLCLATHSLADVEVPLTIAILHLSKAVVSVFSNSLLMPRLVSTAPYMYNHFSSSFLAVSTDV